MLRLKGVTQLGGYIETGLVNGDLGRLLSKNGSNKENLMHFTKADKGWIPAL